MNAQLAEPDDLQVELLDRKGNPLPGFGRDRSRLLVHDKHRYSVVWQNNGVEFSLSDVLKKQPLVLRFTIRRGALYAFQFVD